eukprot:TRINITY_DN411_c1_g1_i1.p1 TRINITY_DN411_c1_g1~~TRINITY_DN411_c1_g1_i1.p1  ORF type:complete len:379 (+),score=100.84 TRINITY_DN411_c1_g1_i1:86-1138(+)
MTDADNSETLPPLSEEGRIASISAAQDKFARGKAKLREDALDEAIDLLSDAIKVYTRCFGEVAIECAPVYYSYGDALLRQAEASGDVLGAAISAAADKDEAAGTEQGEGAEDAQQEEEAEDDPLQTAWECLDTARAIQEKHLPETAVALSDTLIRIGELSAELENLDQAVEDFGKSLSIREKLEPADPRRVAEAHSSMGMAYSFKPEPEAAAKHYRAAAAVLRAYTEQLMASGGEQDKVTAKELTAYIDQLLEKAEDSFLTEAATKAALTTAVTNVFTTTVGFAPPVPATTATAGEGAAAVNDLSRMGLVKRRVALTTTTPATAVAASAAFSTANTEEQPEKRAKVDLEQ